MKFYQVTQGIDWEFEDTIIYTDSYEAALEALVKSLNSGIYLGNVDGLEGDGTFRHYYMIYDHYSIVEHELNNPARSSSNVVLKIFDSQVSVFTHSTDFYKGCDFTADLVESWNKVDALWSGND